MNATPFEVGAYVEIADDWSTTQEGTLFRVTAWGRKHHIVRQVSERTGDLIGVPVGDCTERDLVAARPETLDKYAEVIAARLEVQRVETTHYSTSYGRCEVVRILSEADRARKPGHQTRTGRSAT